MSELTNSAVWRELVGHADRLCATNLNELFQQQPERAEELSAEAVGLFLDFSKQRVDSATLDSLYRLASQCGFEQWRERLFAGEAINHTEGRAAYHMALRCLDDTPMCVDGENVIPLVAAVRERFCGFAEAVRSGRWTGATGGVIGDVVNIGIGGSDLGPRMVCQALAPYCDGPRSHFVANVDGAELSDTLARLDPAQTLFIITSKTFTTQETMANAHAARRWLVGSLGDAAVARHFVAVSTNADAVQSFGIAADNMFEFWDWVGGRYSLWSAVGVSIAVAIGAERFVELLSGAQAMDRHFASAAGASNLPLTLGLLAVWNTNFLDCPTQVLAPYSQRLQRFPAWAQQLEMESNGKSVDRDGVGLDYRSTPVLWGDVGTNAQHAYFQMLHQGTDVNPVDFVLPLAADHELHEQQKLLIANCLAQGAALMRGKDADTVRAELSAQGLEGAALDAAVPHRVFGGNRPSNTLLMPRVDPFHLGALLALYEHRTFVQSVIWNINAFDQWGVELGKQLAKSVVSALAGEAAELDPSTRALVARVSDGAGFQR